MSGFKDSLLKWKDRKYRSRFLSILVFLVIMCTTFYLCVVNGAPNLIVFLVVVIACWGFIVLFLARHVLIGFVMMIAGGFFGYFCDLWGVGNGLWLYHADTISMLVLNGGNLTNGGFPVEIVLSYFFAAMWLTQILESVFDVETEEIVKSYDAGAKFIAKTSHLIPALAVAVISAIIIIIEPLYWEAMGYFSIGVFLLSLVPGNKKSIPLIFGILMGFTGLFFELFCSGQVVPGAVIWTYQQPAWDAFTIPSPRILGAPISAVYAYFGVGAALASIYLLLLKFPAFRRVKQIINLNALEKKKE